MKSPTLKETRAIVESAYKSYYTDLKEALEAVKQLRASGLTNQDIIPLLQSIPLDRWSIFARRFLNQNPEVVETKKWYGRLFDYRSLWSTKESGGGTGGSHGGHH
jgi:hypothetical protein